MTAGVCLLGLHRDEYSRNDQWRCIVTALHEQFGFNFLISEHEIGTSGAAGGSTMPGPIGVIQSPRLAGLGSNECRFAKALSLRPAEHLADRLAPLTGLIP